LDLIRTAVAACMPKFHAWNSERPRGHVTMVIPDAVFSPVRFCSYTVRCIRSTIGLLSDSYTLLVVCMINEAGSMYNLRVKRVVSAYHGLLADRTATRYMVTR